MREYGDYQGFKVISQVTNKGKKIVFSVEASAQFEEQIESLDVTINKRNGHT